MSESEISITVPKKTQTLSAWVEDPSRLSAPLGSSELVIAYLNNWRIFNSPTPIWSTHTRTTNIGQTLGSSTCCLHLLQKTLFRFAWNCIYPSNIGSCALLRLSAWNIIEPVSVEGIFLKKKRNMVTNLVNARYASWLKCVSVWREKGVGRPAKIMSFRENRQLFLIWNTIKKK